MEEDIIEIWVNKRTKELAINIPAAGIVYKIKLGKELSKKEVEEYILAGQINLDKVLRPISDQLEELRKEIIAKFAGKNISLNQLLLEYGSNELIDVSVGEPDSPFDYGRWKDQLETFKKAGASDIVLVNVSEGGYGDIISLQTSTIRLIISEPTTQLMKEIENLKPDSIDYQKGYIELFFD